MADIGGSLSERASTDEGGHDISTPDVSAPGVQVG